MVPLGLENWLERPRFLRGFCPSLLYAEPKKTLKPENLFQTWHTVKSGIGIMLVRPSLTLCI